MIKPGERVEDGAGASGGASGAVSGAASMALGDQDRMTELGVLTAGLLHELRQPLFVLKSCIDMLERDPGEIVRRLEELRGQVQTMEALVEGYGDFSRPVGRERHAFDPRQPLRSALPVLQRRAASAGVRLTVDAEDAVAVVGIPLAIQQAIVNLGNNAIEALIGRTDGEVALWIEIEPAHLCLHIRDNGPGLPEEMRQDLFRPFRTTKAGGTGLGLVLAQEAVALSGGNLRLREGEGTHWEIWFERITAAR